MNVDRIHERALKIVGEYKRHEAELVGVLAEVDAYKVFIKKGFSSLFKYAVDGLGLSEEVAYIFIRVARKVREVPALKREIDAGRISVSKAKSITSVLTKDNQKYWLRLAAELPKRKLEKEVAAESPREAVRDKASYVSRDRLELQVGVSEKLMLKLRRVQDVLSQKRQRPVGLEEALEYMTDSILHREDPLEVAKRQKARGKLQQEELQAAASSDSELVPGPVSGDSASRKPLLASVRHRVRIRFQDQCGYMDQDGRRCTERRFLQFHHIQPVAEGGGNESSNLELLCAGHHKLRHSQ